MKEKKTIKSILKNKIPQKELNLINRSFEIIGDIAITEIPKEVEEYEKDIGEAILKINSSIKTVLKKSGIHEGEFRTQKLEYVFGENKKETIYTENGIRLKLNVEEVYFSSKLSTERENLMSNIKNNSKILIMFSGCGPYSFVAFRKNPEILDITSIEINPIGHKFALKNMQLNKNIIKKTLLFKETSKYLKEKNYYFQEKELIQKLLNLKLLFLNKDVNKIKELFQLRESKEKIEKFDNPEFNISNKFSDKVYLKFPLNQDNIIKFILEYENHSFICEIENKIYIFESLIEKRFLFNMIFEIKSPCKFDEIFMPLPKDAQLFLEPAFSLIKKEGIIHMYDFLHENEFPHKSEDAIKKFAKEKEFKIEIISTRKVGQYAPGKFRVCCDFKVLE